MLVLNEAEIRTLVGPDEALDAVREAFGELAQGNVHLPAPVGLDLTDRRGEVHMKGAYLGGDDYFVFKVATGFYGNPEKGLPVGSGVMMAFDAWTGFPAAILLDNGYLTELRTAAAGALACQLLARPDATTLGLVGAGTQARYQARAIARVLPLQRIVVWSRSNETAARFIGQMQDEVPADYRLASSPDEAVSDADVAITVTPSRQPIISADALHTGLHVTCVGADQPGKQELDPKAFARFDRIFVDHREQASTQGELQHPLAAGVVEPSDVAGTLGDLVIARVAGRSTAEQITFCDLTGVGVQDSAVASVAVRQARKMGVGRNLEDAR